MHILANMPEGLAAVLIQLALACFSAGALFATVNFLGKEIRDVKDAQREQQEKLGEHGEDIQGLKVHTHYHG